MNRHACRTAALSLALCLSAPLPALADFDTETGAAVDAAISGEHRSDENKARDRYRKPAQTLEFLGFDSEMTVVEIWPGRGWYTEILAHALKDEGKLYAAQFSVNAPYAFIRRAYGDFLNLIGSEPDIYRGVTVTALYPPFEMQAAPPESADMVLTFRNVHNWVGRLFGKGRYADLYFDAMYTALKPGGILGVVDHRWPDSDNEDPESGNGYISVARTIELAESAGFEFVDQSNILRNPKDDHEHPRGVWTLPPSYALGDEDRDTWAAIGESDRYLLKFRRPAAD